ncbi:TetR/AcrR family transcriptional regulator [Streptomyces oceani]|uniref:TetR family transcriptional regulator n=1 Tax=Streptomyces oceani TaxID=1075402 RepID=A0A1E7JXU5_9ACTN|nr:TetR/AcrR family transcriptional regulator [Streptomyces oceani]OEU96507.1 TetR family transcriptional regulator [Streptomyces oceani]
MTRLQGARERARSDITAAIKEEARRQLVKQGADRLSLRSVARELGMVSSALYRYFPGRDELLTALIIDAYDALGVAAEQALAATPDEARRAADPQVHLRRWQAVCRAVRGWALEHPHEYALIYGSPVPGYAAPDATTDPAARTALALIAVLCDARAAGALRTPPSGPPPPATAQADAARLGARLDLALEPWLLVELVSVWAQLFGLVSFELFGHFQRVVDAREEFFDHATARLAYGMGLAGAGDPR